MQFFVTDEVDRIDLGDGYWVDIKKAMSYADVEKLAQDQEGQASGVPLLLVNIKGWNLPDSDDKAVPVTKENIQRLNPVVAARLLQEVFDRNPFALTPTPSVKPSGARARKFPGATGTF